MTHGDCYLLLCLRVLSRLTPMIDTYRRKMAERDYETKVPEKVQATNNEKLASYQAEYDATAAAMQAFQAMK